MIQLKELEDYVKVSKIKIGDRVKKMSGQSFMNGDKIVTVSKITNDKVWFKESGTYFNKKGLHKNIEVLK